jgi:hypothetical protein
MRTAKPQAPSTNREHAGADIVRVHAGCSTISIMIMVMTTAEAVAVGSPARIVVPANGLIVHGQDDRAKGGCIGAAGWNNGSLARHRVGWRRLAFSAMAGGQS